MYCHPGLLTTYGALFLPQAIWTIIDFNSLVLIFIVCVGKDSHFYNRRFRAAALFLITPMAWLFPCFAVCLSRLWNCIAHTLWHFTCDSHCWKYWTQRGEKKKKNLSIQCEHCEKGALLFMIECSLLQEMALEGVNSVKLLAQPPFACHYPYTPF